MRHEDLDGDTFQTDWFPDHQDIDGKPPFLELFRIEAASLHLSPQMIADVLHGHGITLPKPSTT